MGEVTVVEVGPQMVLGMRSRGEYEKIGTMIPKVCQFAAEKGIKIQEPPVYIRHELTAEEASRADKERNADIEVAVPISEKVESSDEIKFYELPGGEVARIVHKGPYIDWWSTYKKLFIWLEEKGKKVVGPTREVLLNELDDIPQEEFMTEIYAPIE